MSEFWNQIIQAVAPLLAIGIALDLVSTWAVAERKRRRRREWQDRRAANDAEHAKVTRQMRDEVRRRDGYRCVMCGRSAKDGVKLHVDHIRPVSKGGKSVMDNLQTLCEDCNLGKGNRV